MPRTDRTTVVQRRTVKKPGAFYFIPRYNLCVFQTFSRDTAGSWPSKRGRSISGDDSTSRISSIPAGKQDHKEARSAIVTLEIDAAVAVDVCRSYHVLDLVVCERFSEI